ncbi:MAG: TrkA family potassium uptake protein [Flavobacteriales bacterium]|jgi:trk system potassium uptake protein TrkA|nr:TrkA family potassium uptake protein [Flavobacteriales bacterium]NCG29292.1 NAD(P)-binding domain-containing protein [Bacteroidota bacterium]MBT3962961.1 TrkA family potassium uptake protein [Flavobacteriales bacterium]MBT4705618.1 TrkA family potassium uptake protein [Flavobacteriales bacterium]MBT4931157.1 TrkA family potassium uptake protein [Flavobacteriales bacterium]
MARRYAVIGLGQFGRAIALVLASKGGEVVAIDNNPSHVELIKDDVAHAIAMDATDRKALVGQGIHEMDAIVLAIGKDFEALLLAGAHLLELNANRIIARAHGKHQRMILERLGITEILSPEDEIGKIVAERLLNPNILSFLELPDSYEIVEIRAPKGIINRSLEDVGLRDKYKLTVITIKREFVEEKNGEHVVEQHVLGVPSSKTTITENDTLMVFGQVKDIQRFTDINE